MNGIVIPDLLVFKPIVTDPECIDIKSLKVDDSANNKELI